MNELLVGLHSIWLVAGWTMLHFLWVGTLLAVAAWATRDLLWWLRVRATWRYLAALGWFVLLAAAPLVIAALVAASADGPETRLVDVAMIDHQPFEPAAAPSVTTEPPAFEGAFEDPAAEAYIELKPDAAAPPSSLAVPEGSQEGEAGRERQAAAAPAVPVPAGEPAEQHRRAGRSPAESPASWDRLTSLPVRVFIHTFAAQLPWLWLIGSPLTFALLMTGLVGAERLRRASRPLEDRSVHLLADRLARQIGLRRAVLLAVSERIVSPTLVGIVRPMILLPASALAGWTPQQLEMVLLHELAHVRRWDNLVNLFQRVIESVLFFHPAVWLVSRWVHREREHCCDELVVEQTEQPQLYVETLAALAMQQMTRGQVHVSQITSSTASCSSMARRDILHRIRYLLNPEDESMRVSRKSLAITSLLTGLLLVLLLWNVVPSSSGSQAEADEPLGPFPADTATDELDDPFSLPPALDDPAALRTDDLTDEHRHVGEDRPGAMVDLRSRQDGYVAEAAGDGEKPIADDAIVEAIVFTADGPRALVRSEEQTWVLELGNRYRLADGRSYQVERIDEDQVWWTMPPGDTPRATRLGQQFLPDSQFTTATVVAIVRRAVNDSPFVDDPVDEFAAWLDIQISPDEQRRVELRTGDVVELSDGKRRVAQIATQGIVLVSDSLPTVHARLDTDLHLLWPEWPYEIGRPVTEAGAAVLDRPMSDQRPVEDMTAADDEPAAIGLDIGPPDTPPAAGRTTPTSRGGVGAARRAGDMYGGMPGGGMSGMMPGGPGMPGGYGDQPRTETPPTSVRYDGQPFHQWRSTLLNELKAERRVEAIEAVTAFGQHGYPEAATQVILQAMESYNHAAGTNAVIKAAEQAIVQMGEKAIPALIEAIQGDSLRQQQFIARISRNIVQQLPPQSIARLIRSEDSFVRSQTLSALRARPDVDGRELIEALLELTETPDQAVRLEAYQALVNVDDPRASLAVARALNDPELGQHLARVLVRAPGMGYGMSMDYGAGMGSGMDYDAGMGYGMEDYGMDMMDSYGGMPGGMGMGRRARTTIAAEHLHRIAEAAESPEALAEALVEDLQSDDPQRRSLAQRLLLNLGPEYALPALEKVAPEAREDRDEEPTAPTRRSGRGAAAHDDYGSAYGYDYDYSMGGPARPPADDAIRTLIDRLRQRQEP